MTLEEYIHTRKKEDGINEYDFEKKQENVQICINYVFEYFNNYLDTKNGNEKTVLHEQKIAKYNNMLSDYETEIREWLVQLYSAHGKYIHRYLIKYIDEDEYFLLYNSEPEFRALSYRIYSKAVKQFKFLDGHSEMIYEFIKDAHRIQGNPNSYEGEHICEYVDEWIEGTYKKHGVNLYSFCESWIMYFGDNNDIWPVGHKKKSKYYQQYEGYDDSSARWLRWEYDYKQKSNLFKLDSLYRNMPKKSFVKGKKQAFEALLLYCYLHGWTTDDEYWNEYIQIVEPNL